MKKFKQAAKYGSTVLLIAAGSAHAALPAAVTTAISDAQTDGVSLAGLFLAMAVAVGVLFWLKRKAG